MQSKRSKAQEGCMERGELPEQPTTLPASFPIDFAWEVGREARKSQSHDRGMLQLSLSVGKLPCAQIAIM